MCLKKRWRKVNLTRNFSARYIKIILIAFVAAISACVTDPHEDRLDGNEAYPPTLRFYRIDSVYSESADEWVPSLREMPQYENYPQIVVVVGEYPRSDGKLCPASGEDLSIELSTNGQDNEKIALNSNLAGQILSPYTRSRYAGVIESVKSLKPTKNNGILEIHSGGDTITVQYRSWWDGHLVLDTLIYEGNEE